MGRANGIFCLEGEWEPLLRTRYTIEHVLRLVNEVDYVPVPYIHRDVVNPDAIVHYVNKWSQREYRSHPILYLAMHGYPDGLKPGDGRMKSMDFLAQRKELKGRLTGRVVFISACGGLKDERGKDFLKLTKAKALLGYTGKPDWERGTITDYLILKTLARCKTLDSALKQIQCWQSDEPASPKGTAKPHGLDIRQWLREFGFRIVR